MPAFFISPISASSLPLLPLVIAPIGKTFASFAAGLFDDETRDGGIVVDRIGVRHRTDAGPTAGDRRGRAAGDRLFVLLTRLTQVRVQIDETGRDDQSGCVEHVRVFGRGFRAVEQTDDTAFFDQHVATGVDLLRRIDHISIRNQQFHCWGALRSRFCFSRAELRRLFQLPPASR